MSVDLGDQIPPEYTPLAFLPLIALQDDGTGTLAQAQMPPEIAWMPLASASASQFAVIFNGLDTETDQADQSDFGPSGWPLLLKIRHQAGTTNQTYLPYLTSLGETLVSNNTDVPETITFQASPSSFGATTDAGFQSWRIVGTGLFSSYARAGSVSKTTTTGTRIQEVVGHPSYTITNNGVYALIDLPSSVDLTATVPPRSTMSGQLFLILSVPATAQPLPDLDDPSSFSVIYPSDMYTLGG